MFFFSFVLLSSSAKIEQIVFNVLDGNTVMDTQTIKGNDQAFLTLTENQTLSVDIKSNIKQQPQTAFYVFENLSHAISGNINFKSSLDFLIKPNQLKSLYKHAGIYSLKMTIHVKDDDPIMREIAKVDFIANGEVVDNWTDVEWDFQEPHKDPKDKIIQSFKYVMYIPLGILILLLLLNGCNLGYFPHNPIYALFSLAFVVAFGAFLYYFLVFWREIHFEDMLKQLCVIIPVLLVLLRFALVGRAKMVDKYAQPQKVKTD